MQKLLIVGLGNPGRQYANNRHNIGFLILDSLSQSLNLNFSEDKKLSCELALNSQVILCKPTTFMNLSGECVQKVLHFYKIQNFCVVHDDLDLPLEELRFKKGGGNGGHNGLKSIDALCGNDYLHIRCGIGRPERKEMVASFVLSDFSPHPHELIKLASDALLHYILNQDFAYLQNHFTHKVEK